VVELLLANQVCDRRDRCNALTQGKWHRPIVVTREDI